MRTTWIVTVCSLALMSGAACAGSGAASSGGGVNIYAIGVPIPDSDFVDLTGQIPALGGTVLSGNLTLKARFDTPPDGVTAHGVAEQIGQARVRIVFPFDEHIQVIHGLLKITDANDKSYYLGPGDSYFIAQGSVVIWEVLTPTFQKSFFDYTHK